MLPGLDGLSLLRKLRAGGRLKKQEKKQTIEGMEEIAQPVELIETTCFGLFANPFVSMCSTG